MATRAILMVVLASILVAGIARSDGTSTLTGAGLRTEDVLSKCDAVFVGKMSHVGNGVLGAAGSITYFGNQATVLRILRGSFDSKKTFMMSTSAIPSSNEAPPSVGSSYIIFISKCEGYPDPYVVNKLLPATKDNIATVKKLILDLRTLKL